MQRPRDQPATRAEKRQLVNEVVTVTGLHRKAAIRLLHRAPRMPAAEARTGRPRLYGPAVATAAELLWQAAGRIGPQRLPPCVPELADRLLRCGDLAVAPEIEKLLPHASPATLGRLLAPARAFAPPRGLSTTRPGTWLKHQIPLRTFADWNDARPGFVEVDLVAHCGPSPQGFSRCTLCVVDIATSGVELDAVWGKGQERVGAAIQHVHQRLPVPRLGLHRDTGSAFIHPGLFDSCQRHAIPFPRSRPSKKHDSAHVEQKHGAIVRALIGDDRVASKTAHAQLARVYRLVRLHVTCFQPVQQLVSKTRTGARVPRVYDRAPTPSQRLCAAAGLPPPKHQELEALYQRLNPLQLRRQIEAELDRLWALAAPDPSRSGPATTS
ncbi:MAG: hypothetical protein HYS36_06985 [Candidatus Rokubacteria bacterium]|nr:hypothetical protein [Candidatus Rokubacteria bacterium]